MDNKFLNNLNQSVLVKKVLDVALESKKKEGMSILESDFIGIKYKDKNGKDKEYTEDDVEADEKEVSRLKEIFKREQTKESKECKDYADALEFVVNERIELDNWLGDSAYTYSTSTYDDYKNGIDSIIEFIDEEEFDLSHMGLAFDFTYGSDVFKKFEKIKSSLDSGKLSEIKYFSSDNSEYKGPIYEIPRLVIGASRGTIDDLMELFLESKKTTKRIGDLPASKKLENHYFQINMLKQIIYQLMIFRDYSLKLNNTKLNEKLDYFLQKISKILKDKKKSSSIDDRSREDDFLMRIETACDSLFK